MAKITRRRIDELLEYLPLLTPSEAGKHVQPPSIERSPKGPIVLGGPVYSQTVYAFFKLAAQECWNDYGYDPGSVRLLIDSDDAIAAASMDQIKSMLTFCVRGERFSDGHWGSMIHEGRIQAILRRLERLREDIERGKASQ